MRMPQALHYIMSTLPLRVVVEESGCGIATTNFGWLQQTDELDSNRTASIAEQGMKTLTANELGESSWNSV